MNFICIIYMYICIYNITIYSPDIKKLSGMHDNYYPCPETTTTTTTTTTTNTDGR